MWESILQSIGALIRGLNYITPFQFQKAPRALIRKEYGSTLLQVRPSSIYVHCPVEWYSRGGGSIFIKQVNLHPLKQHRLNSRGEHSLSEWQDGASQKIDLYVGISAVRGTRRWNKSGGVESGGWYGRCGGACVRACVRALVHAILNVMVSALVNAKLSVVKSMVRRVRWFGAGRGVWEREGKSLKKHLG